MLSSQLKRIPNSNMLSLDKIGLVCMAIVGFQLSKFVLKVFYRTLIAPQIGRINVNKLKEMGEYALITGATDGLGKAYAEFLASKGINIILVSRTLEKLNTVAEEIRNKYSVKTHVIQADFCGGPEIYKHIQKECAGYEIGILINNVGMSFSYPEFFLDVAKDDFYSKIINCNIVSVNKMCEIIMPEMVQRKKGVVINISSTSARVQSPLLTVYGATKAYVDKFSTDLAAEYARHGIIVQVVLPGFVATNMSKIRKPTWMAPSAKTFVKHAVNSIGVQEATTGYYPHTIMMTALHAIEAISPSFSRWFVLKTMGGLRARALKKLKQK